MHIPLFSVCSVPGYPGGSKWCAVCRPSILFRADPFQTHQFRERNLPVSQHVLSIMRILTGSIVIAYTRSDIRSHKGSWTPLMLRQAHVMRIFWHHINCDTVHHVTATATDDLVKIGHEITVVFSIRRGRQYRVRRK